MNQNDNSRLKHTISTNIVPKNNEGTYEKTFDNESSNDYVPTKSTKYRRELSRDINEYRDSLDFDDSNEIDETMPEIKHINLKRASWLKDMPPCTNHWIQLNNEILLFYKINGPCLEQDKISELLFK